MIYSTPKNPSTPEVSLLVIMRRDAAILRERAARSDAGIRMPSGVSTHERRAVRLSPHKEAEQ
jgi:hypothetical protein